MALNHTRRLNLKKTVSLKGRSPFGVPYVLDRHGRRIYKWDAYYIGVSSDPTVVRNRDVWELAEYLDKRRQEIEKADKEYSENRNERLERIKIEKSAQKQQKCQRGKWKRKLSSAKPDSN